MNDAARTVLVVDDEPEFVDVCAAWLADEYAVRTAPDGETALEELDDGVDVVLLDRRMPGRSGREVLEEMRDRDDGSWQVALVTAVEPDLDVVDTAFDAYLVKPIEREDLHRAVDSLLARTTYDENLGDFVALAERTATLEATLDADQLDASEEYASLQAEIDAARVDANASLDHLVANRDFTTAFHDVTDDPTD